MPLYMDTHRKVKGVTAAAVAEAHAKDLKVQGKHGVNYRSYWVDEKSETIFCLVEAPNAEAAARVHKEAHGLVADGDPRGPPGLRRRLRSRRERAGAPTSRCPNKGPGRCGGCPRGRSTRG